MKTITLTDQEKQDLYSALSMRCGYIETGTINRAKDLHGKDRVLLKPLNLSQMECILRMENIMTKLF